MASSVKIIDSSLRQITIKVTPHMFMTEIVENACKQLRLSNAYYDLKYKNKALDLTGTFRLSGIPPGSRLELVVASRSPAPVPISLNVPSIVGVEGSKLQAEFANSTRLWDILRAFEAAGGNLNLTGRSDTELASGEVSKPRAMMYLQPVMNIFNRELSNLEDLAKPLANFGVRSNTKNLLIKLTFKPTERLWTEALQENEKYFGPLASVGESEETKSAPAVAPVASSSQADTKMEGTSETALSSPPTEVVPPAPETVSNQEISIPEASPQIADIQPPAVQDSLISSSGQPVTVYNAPSNDTPKAALLPHDEMDYEPTLPMVQATHTRLQSNSQNKQLPSDAEIARREKEAEAKITAIKQVTIRLRFPDMSMVQFTYTAESTCDDLYQDAKNVIRAENEPFRISGRIKTHQPETIPRGQKTLIKGVGISGNAKLDFIWEAGATEQGRKEPTLKSQYIEKAREIPVVLPEPENKQSASSSSAGNVKKEGDGGGKGFGSKMGKFFPGLKGKK